MQTDIPAVTGLICPSTAGKPLRVVFHVFCNKNSDAPGYFLSFRTWLRPCCSKTIYRCIDVWPSFTHFVAGVCRSLLLWCRFKWHIIFEVFDIVYGSLVLQCLQTVFVCNFFYHRPVSWPETQNTARRRTYEMTGHLQFQFPANSCCPTNVQFKQFLQLRWKHRVGHVGSSTNRIRLSSYRKSIATTVRWIP